MSRSRRAGLTLLELALGAAILSLMWIVLFALVDQSAVAWRSIEGRNTATRNLWLVEQKLYEDLKAADKDEIARAYIGSGQGDVIWFLSADDPAAETADTQQITRDPATGSPVWQRNIIYYAIRPSGHDALVNMSCANDPAPNGDGFCPHKFVIRKVVNLPADPETLIPAANISAYTTAPNGYDISGFSGEPGLEESRIIADRILYFQVSLLNSVYNIDLRAVRLAEAQRKITIGSSSLLNGEMTIQHDMRIVPLNEM